MFFYFLSFIVASADQELPFNKEVNTAEKGAAAQAELREIKRSKTKSDWMQSFLQSADPTAAAAKHVVFRQCNRPEFEMPFILDHGDVHHYLSREEFKKLFPTAESYETSYPKQSRETLYHKLIFLGDDITPPLPPLEQTKTKKACKNW